MSTQIQAVVTQLLQYQNSANAVPVILTYQVLITALNYIDGILPSGGTVPTNDLTFANNQSTTPVTIVSTASNVFRGYNNTTGSVLVVNLPAAPSGGMEVAIQGLGGNEAANNIQVAANAGQAMWDGTGTKNIQTNYGGFSVIWNSVAGRWVPNPG